MKTIPIISLSLFLLSLAPARVQGEGEGEAPLTLKAAYQAALRQSEKIGASEQALKAAEGRYWQALGSTLPHISVRGSEQIQDTSVAEAGSGGGSDFGSTFTRRSRPEVALELTQPLFQGFREIQALKSSSAEKKKAVYERARAEQLLLLDVAQATLAVLTHEKEREILTRLRQTLSERSVEIRRRIALGKSRESELLATESQLASAEAELAKTEGLVRTSRDLLGFMMGREVGEILADASPPPDRQEPLESYLARSSERPDLKASAGASQIAEAKLTYEKGGRWPSIDLAANYYPYRVGFYSDIDWDLGFSARLPIFQGGVTHGRIAEARAASRQADLAYRERQRIVKLEVRQAYHDWTASRTETELLLKAEEKAKRNYEAHVEEYRLGLVNNLEVLQSMRDWLASQRQANAAARENHIGYIQLLIAAGRTPEEILP